MIDFLRYSAFDRIGLHYTLHMLHIETLSGVRFGRERAGWPLVARGRHSINPTDQWAELQRIK